MRDLLKIFLLWMVIAVLLLTGCGGGGDDTPPSPTAQEEAFALLAGTWNTSSGGFQLDGQDVSINYPGFSVSFSDGQYSTNNAGSLFRAMGSWEWVDQNAGAVLLDDGKEITIISLTSNRFNFSFSHQGQGGEANGVNGLAGNYNITLVK